MSDYVIEISTKYNETVEIVVLGLENARKVATDLLKVVKKSTTISICDYDTYRTIEVFKNNK